MTQFFAGWLGGVNSGLLNDKWVKDPSIRSLREHSGRTEKGTPFVVSDCEAIVSNHEKSKNNSLKTIGAKLWKKNQPVTHDKFGLGIVQDIELRANGVTILQVKFKSGSKKIDASFVKAT